MNRRVFESSLTPSEAERPCCLRDNSVRPIKSAHPHFFHLFILQNSFVFLGAGIPAHYKREKNNIRHTTTRHFQQFFLNNNMEDTTIVEVIWRGTKLHVEVNSKWTVKEFGENLLLLTNVKPDTLKLLVPQSRGKGSSLLAPFSDDNSSLNLQETGFLKGKPVRMMGVFDDEVNEVSQTNTRSDLRIAGFDDEDKRLRQLSTYKSQASSQLPQGPYIFHNFRTLELPGIELNPPPSMALRIMHKLACDHGIIAIMNKHRWRVGIMTELAPVGYVGISPKCILGFNKNHGEEISLRLRTDDLKGFRKYDSIKKTLLHELAHMVFSEHDANFLALNKQLNEEAVSLDWTKSKSHTLSAHKVSNYYEDEVDYPSDATNVGHKLGGGSSTFASARASSVEAAYHRYLSSHTSSLLESQAPVESLNVDAFGDSLSNELDYIGREYVQNNKDAGPDLDDALMLDNKADNASVVHQNLVSSLETSMIDEDDDNVPYGCRDTARSSEIDNDDSHAEAMLSIDEPDSYKSLVDRHMQPSVPPEREVSAISRRKISNMIKLELDPDDSVIAGIADVIGNHPGRKSEELDSDNKGEVILPEYGSQVLKDSNSSSDTVLATAEPDRDECMSDSGNMELQSIEEPAAAICARIQESIKLLRFELTSYAAASVLQTLLKIIRNIIDHPDELKFRRIRKANLQFQRNVANYKAAMDFLTTVGFHEDVVLDEFGGAETYLVLKRNDPGLLWLAKSSLETVIA